MKVLIVFLAISASIYALDNGVGLKPQMGWNSWNHFGCDISEYIVKLTAEVIAKSGKFFKNVR